MEMIPTTAGKARFTVDECFERGEPLDAPAIVTGTCLHWLRSIARRDAWTLFHADPKRGPFHVEKNAVIRGRRLTIRIFISRYGATYCTRWKVDGHSWTRQQVEQSFGF